MSDETARVNAMMNGLPDGPLNPRNTVLAQLIVLTALEPSTGGVARSMKMIDAYAANAWREGWLAGANRMTSDNPYAGEDGAS